MSIIKAILDSEVYPAVGCTEPVSCAYAAALAAEALGEPVEHLTLRADLGTYKNGAAVVVPHSAGAKGNLIAAAMGAALARPGGRLQLLSDVTPDILARAEQLVTDASAYECVPGAAGFRVEVSVRGAAHTARCVLSEGHTDVECIERDGHVVSQAGPRAAAGGKAGYRDVLRGMSLQALLESAVVLDDDDRATITRGVEMNLAMVEHGWDVHRAAYQLQRMHEQGILADDLFFRVKTSVAAAVDARMGGVDRPVMTSGGSGNQGVVAILAPHLVGRELGVDEGRIVESIAVAHAINAYVKCYVGELSVICGCAIAAGLAAAVAIVYQQAGIDLRKTTFAISNVIGDLSGLICDGAKPGCAMKTVTSVDAAMRAAFMAADDYGLSDDDGVIGRTAEDSIRNLGRLGLEGMFGVDSTVIDILTRKAASRGTA